MNKALLTLTNAFLITFAHTSTNYVLAAKEAAQDVSVADSNSEISASDKILEKAEKKADIDELKTSPLEMLKVLVDSGKFEKAYAQGQEMLFDYEGEPDFDLLYGTSAIEIGENKEAVFIFERLTESDTTNIRYKLELGRVYYQSGEKEKAKSIFENVLV